MEGEFSLDNPCFDLKKNPSSFAISHEEGAEKKH